MVEKPTPIGTPLAEAGLGPERLLQIHSLLCLCVPIMAVAWTQSRLLLSPRFPRLHPTFSYYYATSSALKEPRSEDYCYITNPNLAAQTKIILLYFMDSTVRNSGRAQLGNSSVLCSVS